MQILEDIDNSINAINRQGYEWFIQFLFNPSAAYYKYKSQHPKYYALRLFWSVLWRLVLMIIPVLPAFYVVNRVFGTILNPIAWYKSASKPLGMIAALVATAGLLSVPYRQFLLRPQFSDSAQLITDFFYSGLDAALQIPATVGIGFIVGAAVLYAAKEITRWVNFKLTGSTSRKHVIDNPYDQNGNKILPESLMNTHRTVLMYHQQLKNEFKMRPQSINFNLDKSKKIEGILDPKPTLKKGASSTSDDSFIWVNDREVENPIEAAEEVIQQGKVFLMELEETMQAQIEGEQVTEEQAELVISLPGKTSKLYAWEAAINRVRPKPISVPDPDLEYDLESSKLVGQQPSF